jgi:hypothetical protein
VSKMDVDKPSKQVFTPSLPPSLLFALDFLVRGNYRKSALALASAHEDASILLSGPVLELMDARARISRLVLDGHVLDAIAAADDILKGPFLPRKSLPEAQFMRTAFPGLHFELSCQHFVELLRTGLANDALLFAQRTLAPLAKGNATRMSALQDVNVLLAYVHPEQSPGGQLMALEHRERLAATVNDQLHRAVPCLGHGVSALDSTLSGSAIERILRHAHVCSDVCAKLSPPISFSIESLLTD